MNAILSIKPEFANAILAGIKKVEFRKTLFKEQVEKIFMYSSSPVKKIVGFFTYSDIIKASPQKLWDRFGDVGFINEADFFNYFGDSETGVSICIESVDKFEEVVDPFETFEKFTPPQSFRYCNEEPILAGQLKSKQYGSFLADPFTVIRSRGLEIRP